MRVRCHQFIFKRGVSVKRYDLALIEAASDFSEEKGGKEFTEKKNRTKDREICGN